MNNSQKAALRLIEAESVFRFECHFVIVYQWDFDIKRKPTRRIITNLFVPNAYYARQLADHLNASDPVPTTLPRAWKKLFVVFPLGTALYQLFIGLRGITHAGDRLSGGQREEILSLAALGIAWHVVIGVCLWALLKTQGA